MFTVDKKVYLILEDLYINRPVVNIVLGVPYHGDSCLTYKV